MRVLLDESLPRQLARAIQGHSVTTVRQQGWASLKNGEMLREARAGGFEVLITADQNLEFQHNLVNSDIGVIVVVARTNRIEDLKPLVPKLLKALSVVTRGQVLRVTSSD